MKKFLYKNCDKRTIDVLCARETIDLESVFAQVRPIVEDVKREGLSAALRYAKRFDGFPGENYRIKLENVKMEDIVLPVSEKAAIDKAADNIRRFHDFQRPKPYTVETAPGIICSRDFRPVESVGLYIPGGTAVLPSSVLMLGIPARIAGCKRITAATPVKEKPHPAILYAAKHCGIDELLCIGGAQGIALMAYGTEEFPKAEKIFGPGNQYVTAAKMLCSLDSKGAAMDMPAGPSELLVIADKTAVPAYAAADLLSQAEHGSDSQVVLVTDSEKLADEIEAEVTRQLSTLGRVAYMEDSLNKSFIMLVDSMEQAFEFSNLYAPEHLSILCDNAERQQHKVINAGSVFLGHFTPVSAGDYASGTNHTLPTSGYAKSFGGVTVESFMKSITFQKASKDGLQSLAPVITTLAAVEKLSAHAAAVTVRSE